MSAPNSRHSWSSRGKNLIVQSQSSSFFQYGSTSCCRFIRRPLNLYSEFLAETRDIRRLPLCIDGALMSAAPHYGLRYGSVPATGNFQRLRGRPPLVSPLKSCMRRSFSAQTRVQIPPGTPNLFNYLQNMRSNTAAGKGGNDLHSAG